jgi:hypothetical protein
MQYSIKICMRFAFYFTYKSFAANGAFLLGCGSVLRGALFLRLGAALSWAVSFAPPTPSVRNRWVLGAGLLSSQQRRFACSGAVTPEGKEVGAQKMKSHRLLLPHEHMSQLVACDLLQEFLCWDKMK